MDGAMADTALGKCASPDARALPCRLRGSLCSWQCPRTVEYLLARVALRIPITGIDNEPPHQGEIKVKGEIKIQKRFINTFMIQFCISSIPDYGLSLTPQICN